MMPTFDYQRESIERIQQQSQAWPTSTKVLPEEANAKEIALCRKLDEMYRLVLLGPNRCEAAATEHLIRYKGLYQPPRSAAYKWPRASYNRTMIDMDMKLALQLDSTTSVTVRPATDPAQELNAIAMEQMLRQIAENSTAQRVRMEADTYGGLMGTGIKMVRLKLNVEKGQEEIVIEAVDPRTISCDPNATTPENINFILRSVIMTHHEIGLVFGKDMAKRLRETDSAEGFGLSPKEGAILIREAWYFDDTLEEQAVPILPASARDHLGEANAEMQQWSNGVAITVKPHEDHKCHLESVHVPLFAQMSESLQQAQKILAEYEAMSPEEQEELKPEETEQVNAMRQTLEQFPPEKMEQLKAHIDAHAHALENPRTEKRMVPKYPHGRRTVAAHNKVLFDEPNPYPGFPFFFVAEHKVPGQIFGVSDVSYNKGLSDTANRLIDKSVDIVRHISNITIVPEGMKDKMTNAPAQYVEGEPGQYSIVPSGDLPGGMRFLLPMIINLTNNSSGNEEIAGGRRQPNIVSGAAMDRLIEGTRRRPDLKVKMMVEEDKRMYKFIAELICLRYTGVRVLRLVGDKGAILAEHLRKQEERFGKIKSMRKSRTSRKANYMAPQISYRGNYVDAHYFEVYTERLSPDIDIAIDIGMNAERSVVEDGQLALQLYGQGAIDQIELLTKLRYKNAKEIVERMGHIRNMQQQLAQMEQGLKERDNQLNQASAEIKRLQDQLFAQATRAQAKSVTQEVRQ
jgi:hypothetical protein